MGAGGRKYGMSKTSSSFFFLFAFAALTCVAAFGQSANYKVIHSFSGYPNDIEHPIGAVVFDKAGNMYGVGPGGGSINAGAVFELSPDGHGNWTETILYDFCQNNDGLSCLDGQSPDAQLVIDAAGNLYGTTYQGGTGNEGNPAFPGGGVAFQLSPPQQRGGQWTETILYNFCSKFVDDVCLDGGPGVKSQMVFDQNGNLYGTTAVGGLGHIQGHGVAPGGGGVIFELYPGANGWTEKILYSFCSKGQGDNCPDAYAPDGGVVYNRTGDLYGAASLSGKISSSEGGSLFELIKSGGTWNYKLLASIPDGYQPYDPLGTVAFDAKGNLYGTLALVHGGVYRRDAKTGEIRVFTFNGQNGYDPLGGVYIDPVTNAIYGTNSDGGGGPGNIFVIGSNGRETILHAFCGSVSCTDGDLPWATLVPDVRRNLYGTTEFGGYYNQGVVFELTP
jgi:hypothetical protein